MHAWPVPCGEESKTLPGACEMGDKHECGELRCIGGAAQVGAQRAPG